LCLTSHSQHDHRCRTRGCRDRHNSLQPNTNTTQRPETVAHRRPLHTQKLTT
jgi:hypothetical protein